MDINLTNPDPIQALDFPNATMAVNHNGQELARASLWWNTNHEIENHKAGLIGHFSSVDENASLKLIDYCSNLLKANHCHWAIAPMDGSTWNKYRFKVTNNDLPSFFQEPNNPIAWPNEFKKAGFSNIATYYSLISKNIDYQNPRHEKIVFKLDKYKLKIRSLNIHNVDSELQKIYELTLKAFAKNLFFTEIDFEQFYNIYKPFIHKVDPDLILLLEDASGKLIGYIFGLVQQDTVILKTLAIDPLQKYKGLGICLVQASYKTIKSKGYKTAIHALIQDKNPAYQYAKKTYSALSSYELLAKKL